MRSIGELEMAVMEAAWASGEPCTVRVLLEAVNAVRHGKPLAYTTVMTVVGNLTDKGLLLRQTTSRAFTYEPSVSREQYTASLMQQALASAPDRTAALLQFAGELSAADRAALRSAVGKRRAR